MMSAQEGEGGVSYSKANANWQGRCLSLTGRSFVGLTQK